MSIFDWWLKVMKSIFIFQKLKKEKRYQIPRYIIVLKNFFSSNQFLLDLRKDRS